MGLTLGYRVGVVINHSHLSNLYATPNTCRQRRIITYGASGRKISPWISPRYQAILHFKIKGSTFKFYKSGRATTIYAIISAFYDLESIDIMTKY